MTLVKTSRRQFLRGLGVSLALPALPSLAPRSAWGIEPGATPRFVQFFAPNGADMTDWHDAGGGAFVPKGQHASLAPYADKVSLLSDLALPFTIPGHDWHLRSLLSERLGDGDQNSEGPHELGIFGRSLDTRLAPFVSSGAVLPRLALASEMAGACGDEVCEFLHCISWSGDGQPNPRYVRPDVVFELLFGASATAGDVAAAALRRRRRQSVLDQVLGDVRTLEAQVSAAEREPLQAYLDGIRTLELRTDALASAGEGCPPEPGTLSLLSAEDHIESMKQLLVLALQCDVTRVITYMLSASESYRVIEVDGVPIVPHYASHFEPAKHRAITTWQVEQYADLVGRLDGVVQVNGRTLLDDTFLLFCTEVAEGPTHGEKNLPLLLAGKGGGRFTQGRHLRFGGPQPMANLAVSFLEYFGIPQASSFGLDATGSLLSLSE